MAKEPHHYITEPSEAKNLEIGTCTWGYEVRSTSVVWCSFKRWVKLWRYVFWSPHDLHLYGSLLATDDADAATEALILIDYGVLDEGYGVEVAPIYAGAAS